MTSSGNETPNTGTAEDVEVEAECIELDTLEQDDKIDDEHSNIAAATTTNIE